LSNKTGNTKRDERVSDTFYKRIRRRERHDKANHNNTIHNQNVFVLPRFVDLYGSKSN